MGAILNDDSVGAFFTHDVVIYANMLKSLKQVPEHQMFIRICTKTNNIKRVTLDRDPTAGVPQS